VRIGSSLLFGESSQAVCQNRDDRHFTGEGHGLSLGRAFMNLQERGCGATRSKTGDRHAHRHCLAERVGSPTLNPRCVGSAIVKFEAGGKSESLKR
jgi:hypothetical protein